MRLGTMTTLYREQRGTEEHIDYIESMRRCRAAGFQVLDFNMCALTRRKTCLHGEDYLKKIDEIRNEAEKLDITFSQSHPPYRAGREGLFATAEDRDFFEKMALRAIEISALLGVGWAVLHPVTAVGDGDYCLKQNLAYNRSVFEKEVELAEKLNVGIAFENMCDQQNRRRFGTTEEELIALMDEFNSPYVGLCWDTGHGNRQYDNQLPVLYRLGKRIKALHIDDNYGQSDLHMLPFMGDLPWEKIMQALYDIGYEGDFIYEIRTNQAMPDALKDKTARYAYEVGEYLLSLAAARKAEEQA